VGSECTGLPQHRINESGLSMVYVSDDRDVTKVFATLLWQAFKVLLFFRH
jgi:hypothetical protein